MLRKVNKEVLRALFDNPLTVLGMFPHPQNRKFTIEKHGKSIDAMAQLAVKQDSKGFWRMLESVSTDDREKVKVCFLVYHYLRLYYPQAMEWFLDQQASGKSLTNF
ncbi:hypothetical protein [Chroococcidiopsis thermalis]|uniref:Uncharacterized protein n=1 Tax=Chroococcidiopsis thermalis (strain PCC 7203) TaxID=251229 RepID=K9TWY1_CHRTP|nr:hypothetical protein [Chroococcidiopsis thermalis]AFY86696.1 hypothetical protein Chro_1168 [Chroococcidiopsis thermalis PCC 7203]